MLGMHLVEIDIVRVLRLFTQRDRPLQMRVTWIVAGSLCGAAAGCSQTATMGEPLTPQAADAADDMALAFDGEKSYASTGTAAFPFAGAPQTLSCWLAYDGGGGSQSVLALHRDFDSGVQLGVRDGQLAVWRSDTAESLLAAEEPLAIADWHHAAYVYEGEPSRIGRLYIDGDEVAQAPVEMTERTPSSGWLGTVDGTRELFRGRLDEVRVWTAARTPSEVVEDMTRIAPARDRALVAYFTFDEAGGPWALDRSGRGNHAVLGDGVADYMPRRVASALGGSRRAADQDP